MGWSAFLFYSDLQWIWWGSTRLGRAISFVVIVVLLNRVWIFATPWTAVCQVSLPFTISRSLLKLMLIESVMLYNHLKPMDCSPSGSSIHGILQAKTLEWVAIPSPGDLSDPGIEPRSPTLQVDSLLTEPPGKPQFALLLSEIPSQTHPDSMFDQIFGHPMAQSSWHTKLTLPVMSKTDCSPPGSSVNGILQARILEWVAIPSSRASSRPRDQPKSPVSFALQVYPLPLSHPGSPYVVTEPHFESYSKFPLAIYFTCGNVCFHVALSIQSTLCSYSLDVSDTNNWITSIELFQKLPCTSASLVSYSGEWDLGLASGELCPGGVQTSEQIIRAQSDLREVTQWLQEPHQEVFLSLAWLQASLSKVFDIN